ncbi:iron(III) transport system permease protein [Enhydrobacter aerosaccus]|uniref:Iron(III) transport system permease protein n=1 Tax=Enhydrobacter aerosaccus TaxID=225324 RepID=A0A1T4SHD4_9HYPH|nr:iron ABC transporter permease [Enhydrobacter aerosaccus]SKA27595.1 iron(III) transport system permease protein [Enhydrobacter aerosaccus]
MGSAALWQRSDRATVAGALPLQADLPLARVRRLGRPAGIAALLLLLGFLSVYPMAMLLYGSLHSTPPGMAGEFNLDGYASLLTQANLIVLANTVGISLVKTVLSIALAILLAWIIARTDTPGRGLLEVLITLPFFIPPILTATAWAMLGNAQVGTINLFWRWLTGSDGTLVDVYSYGGVIWHMMQYSTPFIFLFVVDAFRAMDPSLEESSRMSGATRWQTFWRITFVLMLPVTTSAFILSFIRGMESFESAVFFGTPVGINVITTAIYDSITQRGQPDYQFATSLGFAAMVLMFLLLVLQSRLLKGRSFTTVTGKGYAPNVTRLGGLRWMTFGICVAFVVATVVMPIGQLLLSSFFQFFGFYQLDMLTLDHYRAIWTNDEFWSALANTMLLGFAGATATMALGAIVAYITTRTTWPGRRLIDLMAWLPWMMPGMVLGVGFLWGFATLPHEIPIYGTLWALFLAYVALGTPVSVRVMSGAYQQIARDIEECSRVHGAGWWQTLVRILIALAWPAFAVGWVLVFFGIMRELSASILLYAPGTSVLSVTMLKMWVGGKPEEVSVIGLFMLALVLLFRWVQLRFIKSRLNTL